MEKWNLIVDVAKCEECNNCFLSCKDEHVGNDFLPYAVSQPRHGHRWVDVLTRERGQCPMVDVANFPVSCMHCDNAPCVKNAKDGSVYKMENGIVIIDPQKARGQKDIVKTCPYGTIFWNEEQQVAQKCTLYAHLLTKGWKEPRCVQACPTGARRLIRVEDSQMAEIVKQENLEVFHPEYQTHPRVYYKNLYRYLKGFLGGNVAIEKDGIVDCAEGAKVTLFKDSRKIAELITDTYGDFKFDNLEQNSGRYHIEAVYKTYAKQIVEIDLTTSKNVGTILIKA